jgi:hypothetical protein
MWYLTAVGGPGHKKQILKPSNPGYVVWVLRRPVVSAIACAYEYVVECASGRGQLCVSGGVYRFCEGYEPVEEPYSQASMLTAKT